MRGRRLLMGALPLAVGLLLLVVISSHVLGGRTVLIVVCSIYLAYWCGTVTVLSVRREWTELRRFLFAFTGGIYGAPQVFWAALALAALVRVLV